MARQTIAGGPLANITLRQCFSHASGLPGRDPIINDTSITLRQAAIQLASTALLAPPGTTFHYGGVSMHLAGAVCEVEVRHDRAGVIRTSVTLG